MEQDYLKFDKEGYLYNGMFPPEGAPEPGFWLKPYSGYKNAGEEAIFYDYAVQGYNIDFKYKGKAYALIGAADGIPLALLDDKDKVIQRFTDPIDAICHCMIEGKNLLDILADITDIECG